MIATAGISRRVCGNCVSKFAKYVLLIIVCTLVWSLKGVTYAGDYYVSLNGNASWASCGNINTPCSPTTAMTNAHAGDTVYFRGGIYTVGQSVGYHGVLEPVHSGTAGNPITFKAYPGEVPIINSTADPVQDNSRGMGNGDQDYIVFDGFTFQANGGAKMGGMIITGVNKGTNALGCIVRNCTFNGGTTRIATQDNRETLRLEKTSYTIVQRCTFYNALTSVGYFGVGAIKMYNNDHTTIENCELYANTHGIYLKSNNKDVTVRYNHIHNNHLGIWISIYVGSQIWNADGFSAYHNVLANNTFSGINTDVGDVAGTDPHMNDSLIYNNTIYNSVRGISVGQNQLLRAHAIYNNIIQGNQYTLWTMYNAGITNEDHNNFGNGSLNIQVKAYSGQGKAYSSLTAWKDSHQLEDGANPGTGSIGQDALFTNASGNYSRLTDFVLSTDSPCRGAGRGGVDMGANISLVGVNGGRPALSAPKDLRIVLGQ